MGILLGQLTIVKNKALFSRYIDFKQIIKASYLGNYLQISLLLLISFLKDNLQSKIFNTKNPWIKFLIGIILEIKNVNVQNCFVLRY